MHILKYQDNPELCLIGTTQELNHLSDILSTINAQKKQETTTIQLDHTAIPPYDKAYNKALDKIILSPIQTKIEIEEITTKNNTIELKITGNSESLKILAINIESTANKPELNFLHIEYYEDHPYLSDKTPPLVIVNRDNQ